MSECVVRMERVPKNCDDGCWGMLSGECPWCDSIDGYKMVGNRPPNCPIIAVLPDGHGDLIDRGYAIATACSGLIRTLANTTECGEDWIRVHEVRESIKSAPTIVPAERSET